MSFHDFQDGHHSGQQNESSKSKCPFHPNASHQVLVQTDLLFRNRHGLNIFKLAIMPAILDSERNDFSNSESLYCSDAFHQVLVQSDLRLGRRCRLKIFKMVNMVAILDIGTECFKQF